jgi:glycosyltransferase involved in cell wall biosynthesis
MRFRGQHSGPCELDLYGAGPLRSRIPEHPDIHVHAFATPSLLSAALNEARCLILPSVSDHWGLVVHEAAACGALLIVSDATGASEDLCGPTNSRIIRAASEEDMVEAFQWAASLTEKALIAASQESVDLAAAFSVAKWAATFDSICGKLQA